MDGWTLIGGSRPIKARHLKVEAKLGLWRQEGGARINGKSSYIDREFFVMQECSIGLNGWKGHQLNPETI